MTNFPKKYIDIAILTKQKCQGLFKHVFSVGINNKIAQTK